jgi:hypothetical protein
MDTDASVSVIVEAPMTTLSRSLASKRTRAALMIWAPPATSRKSPSLESFYALRSDFAFCLVRRHPLAPSRRDRAKARPTVNPRSCPSWRDVRCRRSSACAEAREEDS